ncbi:enoyl-CoA hydratase-related protein [Stenotrophomonas sp.]|uniref:enoyl-CoA hydratase-related protein n=1 Tax=Stenotrophomonas sp. TaxID=69392 RepID=UPI0028ADD829|nr:enoyl-CoA hydratase-related protein [Stenotrophomonas sp.]
MNNEAVIQLGRTVSVQRVGAHVALVTLQRPQVRNAIDAITALNLEQAVQLTDADSEVRCVILTGAGDQAFCAGADLKAIANGEAAALSTTRGGFAGFVHQPRRKPWIAAVNGLALAGGTEIALACDLIVAAGHAAFGLPEVRRGLVAAAGGLYRLTRAIPRALAIELILTGEQLPAARAQAIGLVNQVVPGPELLATAIALAERISANAPLAVCESLAVARAAFDHDDRVLREMSASAIRAVTGSRDYLEGPRAFLERRPQHWSGT